MRWIVCGLMIVGLAGCASPEEQAARSCTSLGYTPGTPPFMQCEQADLDRRSALIGAYIQSGALNYHPAPVYAPMPVYRPPVQTNCYRVGNNVNCTSY